MKFENRITIIDVRGHEECPFEGLEDPKSCPVVIRSGPDTLLVVHQNRTWTASVKSVLSPSVNDDQNMVRSITMLRRRKQRPAKGWSAKMSPLGRCKTEARPVLLWFPIRDELRLIVRDFAWRCPTLAALKAPLAASKTPREGSENVDDLRFLNRDSKRGGDRLDADESLRIQSEDLLRQLCAGVEELPDTFETNFRPVLQFVLSRLIEWAERDVDSALKQLAGSELAECLKFLSAQQQRWIAYNPAFAERTKKLYGVRLPDAEIAWLATDYLLEEVYRRESAHNYCLAKAGKKLTAEEKKREEKWLPRLVELPAFGPTTWRKWALAVYARMREDEASPRVQRILSKMQTRESRERRKSGAVRISDCWKTIFEAIRALASKSTGSVRGLTKPPESSVDYAGFG